MFLIWSACERNALIFLQTPQYDKHIYKEEQPYVKYFVSLLGNYDNVTEWDISNELRNLQKDINSKVKIKFQRHTMRRKLKYKLIK